jgi:hypothetical protein
LEAGRLKALIGLRLPLSETRQAHERQEAATVGLAGNLHGKIVLQP